MCSALFRPALRAFASKTAPRPLLQTTCQFHRFYTQSPILLQKDPSKSDLRHDAASTIASPGESGDHEGQFARTDESVRVEYPTDAEFPPTVPVQGRGGKHFKRTLASFSLEGRVGVVTGGARGLGLVMAQALTASGADVALVDLNKEEAERAAAGLAEMYKSENPGTER
jgi:D-arabinitol 2-dehydrogenase